MKKFTLPIVESALVVALVGLFTIPIVAFNYFSPDVEVVEDVIEFEGDKVLGAQTVGDFQVELLSFGNQNVQLEELQSVPNEFRANIYLSRSEQALNDNVIRLINPSPHTGVKLALELHNPKGLERADDMFIKIDSTRYNIGDLVEEVSPSSLISLAPGEYTNVTLLSSEPIDASSVFELKFISVQ